MLATLAPLGNSRVVLLLWGHFDLKYFIGFSVLRVMGNLVIFLIFKLYLAYLHAQGIFVLSGFTYPNNGSKDD